MKIILDPQRRDDELHLAKFGDRLVVNGQVFDFSNLADGEALAKDDIGSEWFAADAKRVDGVLQLRIWLPNPWNYSPEQAFPEPLEDVPDGVVELPVPLPEPEPPQDLE